MRSPFTRRLAARGALAAQRALTALAVAAALAATGCAAGRPAPVTGKATVVDSGGQRAVLRGTPPPITLDLPALTLLTTAGRPYNLRASTAGRAALVYFGYTHCPDVCPETMATMAAALRNVPPAVSTKIALIFITTDPARDTAPVLWTWVRRIDTRIVGLRGSTEQVAQAMRLFGIRSVPIAQPGGDYQLDHSATVTAFTPDGQAVAVYPPTMQVADWIHDLPLLAAGPGGIGRGAVR